MKKKPVYMIETKLINDKKYLCGYRFIGELDEGQPSLSGDDIYLGELPRDLFDDNFQPLYYIESKSLIKSPLPTPEIVLLKQELKKLKVFLTETDWYVIRAADNGTPAPEEIAAQRERARTRINEIQQLLDRLP